MGDAFVLRFRRKNSIIELSAESSSVLFMILAPFFTNTLPGHLGEVPSNSSVYSSSESAPSPLYLRSVICSLMHFNLRKSRGIMGYPVGALVRHRALKLRGASRRFVFVLDISPSEDYILLVTHIFREDNDSVAITVY